MGSWVLYCHFALLTLHRPGPTRLEGRRGWPKSLGCYLPLLGGGYRVISMTPLAPIQTLPTSRHLSSGLAVLLLGVGVVGGIFAFSSSDTSAQPSTVQVRPATDEVTATTTPVPDIAVPAVSPDAPTPIVSTLPAPLATSGSSSPAVQTSTPLPTLPPTKCPNGDPKQGVSGCTP